MADEKDLTKEIASRSTAMLSDFMSSWGLLPDPDPILRDAGTDIETYKKIELDGHVTGLMEQRKSGVRALEWEIDRGKAKSTHAKFIDSIFKNNIDIDQLVEDCLDSLFWGYTPLEINWEAKGDYIVPSNVVQKPREWFMFDTDNQLRFISKSNPSGELLPPNKFLLAQHKPSYNNPYGVRLFSKLFWPIVFKKGGLKFWAIMVEKYGMPFLVGKQPRGKKQEETNNFLSMLSKMVQDAVAVIPDDSKVEFLENNRASNGDIYDKLLNFLNSEMSKAILSQTQSTEITGTGTYASSQTHREALMTIYNQDKKLVEKVINQLIKIICDVNFATVTEYPKFIMFEEQQVDKELADRDKVLTDQGVKFNKDYYVEAYGLKAEHFEVTEPMPKQVTNPNNPNEFSEGEDKTFPERVSDLLPDKALQLQIEQVLKPVLDLVNSSSDYSEIIEKLPSLYPDMKTSQLEDLLTKAIFLTQIQGMNDGSTN